MKRILTLLFIFSTLSASAQIQRLIGDSVAVGVKPSAKINLDGSITAKNFNGKRPITASFASGFNPNTNSLIEWINAVFYPSQPPTASLTGGQNLELFSGSMPTRTVYWTAGRQAATEPLQSVIITSSIGQNSPQTFSQPSAPGSVSGSQSYTVTSLNTVTYTLTVTASDGKTATSSTSFTFLPKRYWGRTSTAVPDNSTILTSAGGGSELTSSRAKNGFAVTASGSNQIFYAYPSSYGDLTSLTIGGFESLAAFTKNVISVTNASGYVQNYNVYVSKETFSGNTPSINAQ